MLATTYSRHSLLTEAMMLALSDCGQPAVMQSLSATQPPAHGD
ncbi:hypothetical protein [Nodosilinea sp. FACHB-13]|nr:hypothetical protein [Nodosilinea sp. FACHB-13]